MSVITPEGTLVIENSHLDVRGNVNAVALKLGTARLTPSYDLAAVTGVGNTTPYTVEFSNATTGLATTSNLQVGGTLKLGGTVDFENPLSLAAVSLVSNTTPYTIEFSNAATGIATTANIDVGGELAVTGNATVSSNLTVSGNTTVSSNLTVGGNATVSSNLTVTGDLNVSGALGILDAIYPVGTVIDRATAITDTHPNGKYKAFLAAPDQEWELVDNGSNILLEYLTQDGTTTSFCGRATLVPATAAQSLSTSLEPVTGTTITDFVPVLGTTKLKISCQIMCSYADVDALWHFRWQVKEAPSTIWVDVSKSSVSIYTEKMPVLPVDISMVFHLSDTVNDLGNGRTTSVRPTLNFRLLGRDYSNSHDGDVHLTDYHFTVDNQVTHISQFRPPILDVVSFGSEMQAITYKRTV